jgi:chemotaxis protein histidine kinase CheA
MNTRFRHNHAPKPASNGVAGTSANSWISRRRVAGAAVAIVMVISATACGQQAASSTTALASKSESSTATPTSTPTAPASSSCVTEGATEQYPPKVFICTKSDAGTLLWMEQSESKKVTDARAAAEKLAAEKAAADKAAQDAAAKAAQEQAAAEAARQQAAADEAARQQAAAAAAAAAAAPKVQAPVKPAAPAAPSGCDPNYAGACVPIASDVDCAGGSGNGPAYVRGPVTVIGSDIYGLDSNHDGVGCER